MKVRLRELRKAKGWTQDQLAARLNVSKAHISEMETGKKNPSGPVLDRMAKLFDVNVPDLIVVDSDDPDDLGYLIARFPTLEPEDQALIVQIARRSAARRVP